MDIQPPTPLQAGYDYYSLFLPLRTGRPCKPSSSWLHAECMWFCPRIKVVSWYTTLGFWHVWTPPTLPTFWLFCFQTSPQWWWTRRLKSAEFFFHSGSTLWHLKKENKTVISFHTFQNNALMRGFAHFKNVGESGKPKVARGRISGETYTCYISKHNYLPFPGWQCCSAF